MCRRVSAGELEDRYKLKHLLLDFTDEMRAELRRQLEVKGLSWKECDKKYLKEKLLANVKKGHWVDAANFAFMLRDKELNPSP